jgi:hypothetical protein
MRSLTLLALAVILGLSVACASHSRQARQILDEGSGNTFFVVRTPFVFARERTDVAAHARDYATIAAVAVDQSGTFSEYLLMHRWSTVDRRMLPAPGGHEGELRILAEGRVIELLPLDEVPLTLSSRPELLWPKHASAVTRAYKVDLPTLRFIAASRMLSLRLPQEPLNTPFALWRDGRASLTEFVQSQDIRGR